MEKLLETLFEFQKIAQTPDVFKAIFGTDNNYLQLWQTWNDLQQNAVNFWDYLDSTGKRILENRIMENTRLPY